MSAWLAFCCQLYNAGLEHRIGAWKRARVSIGYYAQVAELVELRAIDDEARSVPSEVSRSALRRLDRAFQAFFRRCKAGERPGFPRFRGRQWYAVRFHRYRELQGEPKEVTIRRSCGRWFVCFSCELGPAPEKVPVRSATGVDLGLTSFAVLSNGSEVANPRLFRAGEEVLARRQRTLARKQRGSRSRERAKILVARAHEHVRQQRLDFSRKLACDLFARYDLVAHEDLTIRNMVRSSSLGKSISDAAWGTFIHCLTSKAESAGRWAVAVDPRGTSQRCSSCGATVRKELAERTHECSCGLRIGRDHNAALNVLALGRSVVAKTAETAVCGATPGTGHFLMTPEEHAHAPRIEW